jgi:fluoride exporter
VTLILVGAGGFFGAIARYLVDGWVSRLTGAGLPWGTLVINVSGSFALGFLFALTIDRGVLPAEIRAPLMIGFIGAYTTFSTWMLESWRLVETGDLAAAVANLAGSVGLGLVAVVLGLAVGRLV